MTIREAMLTSLREILLAWLMILFLLQLYSCLQLRNNKKLKNLAVPSLLQFLALSVLMTMMLDGIFHYNDSYYARTWPGVVEALFALPAVLLIGYEVLSTAYLLFTRHMVRRFRAQTPTEGAVKETLDLLPAGIAFAEENGNVVLTNLAMSGVAQAMTGRILMNTEPLRDACGEDPATGNRLAAFPDGSQVWQIHFAKITEHDTPYLQLTATDVTLQVRANEELQSKHERLQKIRRRLDIYNRQAERIIIAQELLNARMQVHNETGHVLLASRHCLDHPGSIDEAKLLLLLRNTNASLLKEYENDDTERDPLIDAMEMAESIGVTVNLAGALPSDGVRRTILAAAVSECATNTRKHADGNYLNVTVEDADDRFRFRITSIGPKAGTVINESGGLTSLRSLVENVNGEMQITADSELTLTISL